MRVLLVATVAVALLAGPAAAREVAGVAVPDTVTDHGAALRLNGAGIRTRFFFKVYVGALYLPQATRDAGTIVRADGPRRVDLHILRALDGATIAEAIAEGFEKNSRDREAALHDRLERLKKMFPAVKPGDVITLAFVPDRGTVVTVQGAERGVIEGKDFADALFAVWLGPNPVDADLKAALLGG